MSSRRLLPSILFLRSDRRIRAGSPHPLGATWDGRGTNFALFSASAEKVELCLFDTDRPQRSRADRPARAHRRRLAWLSAVRAAGPALRLSRARALSPRSRPSLQSAQAADRSLHQAARRAFRWTDAHLAYRVGHRREDLSFDRRDNARSHAEVRRGRPGAHLGRGPASAACRGKTRSSTRRMSKG